MRALVIAFASSVNAEERPKEYNCEVVKSVIAGFGKITLADEYVKLLNDNLKQGYVYSHQFGEIGQASAIVCF